MRISKLILHFGFILQHQNSQSWIQPELWKDYFVHTKLRKMQLFNTWDGTQSNYTIIMYSLTTWIYICIKQWWNNDTEYLDQWNPVRTDTSLEPDPPTENNVQPSYPLQHKEGCLPVKNLIISVFNIFNSFCSN